MSNERPGWLARRKTAFLEIIKDGYNGYRDTDGDPVDNLDYESANLVSSEINPGSACTSFADFLETDSYSGETVHQPVLDLDFPAHLEPSTTEGHFHLYLNKNVPWSKYVVMLGALEYAGILEPGFARLAILRGASYVRKPGVKKLAKQRRAQEGK